MVGTINQYCRQRWILHESWYCLNVSQSHQFMITLIGLDHVLFNHVAEKFAPSFESYSLFTVDYNGKLVLMTTDCWHERKTKLVDSLATTLTWTRMNGLITALQLIFGMITNLSMYLHFGRRLITEVIHKDVQKHEVFHNLWEPCIVLVSQFKPGNVCAFWMRSNATICWTSLYATSVREWSLGKHHKTSTLMRKI